MAKRKVRVQKVLEYQPNGKPKKPLQNASLALWKEYEKQLESWEKDDEEKKELIAKMKNPTLGRKKRR